MKELNLIELIAGQQSLKAKYLACRGTLSSELIISTLRAGAKTLRSLVTEMLGTGINPQTIVSWSKEHGYTQKHIQGLLSRILIDLGIRRRKRGAGPKSPEAAVLIEAWVRDRHQAHTLKLLRAACRVAQANDEAQDAKQEPIKKPYLALR